LNSPPKNSRIYRLNTKKRKRKGKRLSAMLSPTWKKRKRGKKKKPMKLGLSSINTLRRLQNTPSTLMCSKM
jgi:hypothetical protein